MSDSIELIATSAFGLEAVVARELAQLGYESRTVRPGRLSFTADSAAICRTNIGLRVAERILIHVASIPAGDFDQLFEGTRALAWESWIPFDGCFPVNARTRKSQLTSVPAIQRCVKRAVVERLRAAHHKTALPETGGKFAIHAALLDDTAMLTIDTTGDGLHKRGYRPLSGPAPLRETLAAALVQLSFWNPDRPLIDPLCGTGTIPIEAAMIGRQLAPGSKRQFVAEAWPNVEAALWQHARDEARAAELPSLPLRIIGTDVDRRSLQQARENAARAGVEENIHWQQRAFADLTSSRTYGCVICNPPYGHRMSERRDVDALHRSIPDVLRHLPTWSHFILSAHPDFEQVVGQRADRRRKLYNGRIECQYYQFHGPPPPTNRAVTRVSNPDRENADIAASKPSIAATTPAADTDKGGDDRDIIPVFGGLDESAPRQAGEFRNRLIKRVRHLRRWPQRGISCYRLYERDIPEIPLIVDRYEDRLHIAEVDRPHERTPAQHADWLDLMIQTAADVVGVPTSHVFLKRRQRQRGLSQYNRLADIGETIVVHEGGLRFRVNLSDYVDTGLFLDHRLTRGMFRELADGKRVLNLFGYTGSFTVYAAAGGASATTTVDASRTYLDWARENLKLNNVDGPQHRMIRADAIRFVRDLHPDSHFDLAIVDPPTFSNSKELAHDWDIQRDHVPLLNKLARHVTQQGVIFFSTNYRRFKLNEAELERLSAREITRQTIPDDFRNRRIHRCWKVTVR